jgi:hypothetical protein
MPLLRFRRSGKSQGEGCPKATKMNKHFELFLHHFPHYTKMKEEEDKLVFTYLFKTVLDGSKELAERIIRTRKLPLAVNTVVKVDRRSPTPSPMELIITYKPELDEELKIAAIRDRQNSIQEIRKRESRP